jgi:Protein of unknown function (DUF4199)
MEQITETKKTNFLAQYGIMAALASILFFVILYLGGTAFFGSPAAFLSYVIPIGFAVFACIKAKKENGGFLEFREALKISFGIMVLCAFATSLLSYILFNFIDPGFKESMLQLTIENTQKIMAKFNTPQDVIDKQVQGMLSKDLFSLGSITQSFVFGCVFWFVIALIVAAIMKKKKPEFA